MKTRTSYLILLCAVAVQLAFAVACGAVVTDPFSASVPLTKTSWNRVLSIPRFDPALGMLNSATITVAAGVEGSVKVESLDNAPSTVTTRISAKVAVTSGAQLLAAIPVAENVNKFTAFDTVLDYGGTSGATYLKLTAGSTQSTTISAPSPQLAGFIGAGSVDLAVSAYSQSTGTGAANLAVSLSTFASAIVTVVYDYTPLPCSLGDLVWIDSDGDGVYEPEVGELGVCNVLVSVSGTTSGSMPTSCGPKAGDSGWYLFDGLTAGEYTVTVDPINFEFGMPLYGYAQTYDYEGPLDNTASYALGYGEEFLDLDFGYRPCAPLGTGTPGYWKNHAEAWPVQSIVIGGIAYSKEVAIAWLRTPNDKDKTLTLFRALVCAKLNVGIGNSSSCIEDVIRDADDWMAAQGPAGSGVKANSKAWKQGEPLYLTLDKYNNGGLCAPHRD